MKILLSMYVCDPKRGSEQGRSWNWAMMYVKLGYEVWCVTTSRGKANIEEYLRENPTPNLHFTFVDVPNWVEKSYKYTIGIYLHYFTWQSAAYQTAKHLDRQVNFDAVHHISYGSVRMGSAMWQLDKPLILGALGGGQFPPPAFKAYYLVGWRKEVFRKMGSAILEFLNPNMRRSLKQAKLVLVNNEPTLEVAKKYGAKEIKYFLDDSVADKDMPATMPERPQNEVLKIIWVARLLPLKALPLALEALSKLSPDVKYTLTIIGGGTIGKFIPELLKKYNLENKAVWKGQIPYSEVLKAYRDHDLFLFSSLRDSSVTQLLEAMSVALPYITLNLNGAKVLLPENTGIKIPVTTPEETVNAFTKAIELMYQNPEKRVEMGVKGYQFAKEESWEKKSKLISQFYKELGILK